MNEDAELSLPGLDLESVAQWLDQTRPGMRTGRLGAELIAGGKSNLTYSLTDGAARWILRRPPLGHVLATAHDMAREFTVMSALARSAVPVPQTIVLCEDPAVLGAPFYLMERVDGTPYRDQAELRTLGERRTRIVSERLVDTLTALHAVDPPTIGLGRFGRPEGFLKRQVGRWKKQWDASRTDRVPAADELHYRLAAAAPSESAAGIVHGDFRVDNLLMSADDRPNAVLDWEMATLGDPLTDLALMITYHRLARITGGSGVATASLAPGFLTDDDVIARYDANSERDLSHLGFYLGLAAFKVAAIADGIHVRFLQGKTVGQGFEAIGSAVQPLLETGIDALKEYD